MNITEISKKIHTLKREKNVLILAHNYQSLEIITIADLIGDSFQLSKAALEITADIILFCGVRFMAETAKLLNPNVKVLLSDGDAGCPMADMALSSEIKKYKDEHPQHLIVTYVNSSVEVKALSDVCVTSSNAVKIVQKLPLNQTILFVPDQNLGHYVRQQTKRKINLWGGFCPIHHSNITINDVNKARLVYQGYKIIVHPECLPEVVNMADFVGSTRELADYVDTHERVIIGTEIGLVQMLQEKYPTKSIYALSDKAICPNMKKTSLNDVLNTLQYEMNEIIITPNIAENALLPIQKMMELG